MPSLGVFLLVHILCLPILAHTVGESCTNECGEDQEKDWCGQRRQGEAGEILRCAEKTKGGYMCMDTCGYRGESYTWCYKGVHLKDEWDYCTPAGKVIQVRYTVRGQQCQGECRRRGYWWCYKSKRWSGKNTDADWDYCSLDDRHTRYNKDCRDKCAPRGETYFWCHTQGDWDYCSPDVTEVEPAVTKDNRKCAGICAWREAAYYYCAAVIDDRSSVYWDYCGLSALSLGSRTTAGSVSVLLLLLINVI